jgi:hypothetical protein
MTTALVGTGPTRLLVPLRQVTSILLERQKKKSTACGKSSFCAADFDSTNPIGSFFFYYSREGVAQVFFRPFPD